MALLLLLVFVVAPLVELAVVVQVASWIGVLDTIGLLVLLTLAGVWLTKHQGLGVLRRIQAALDRGEMPSKEVADGGLILLAGALMIAPGFVSDALALLLLFPPTRAAVRAPLLRWFMASSRLTVVSRVSGRRWWSPGEGEVWDVESWESTPDPTPRRELGDPS